MLFVPEFGRVALIAQSHGLFDVYIRELKPWELESLDLPFEIDVVVILTTLKRRKYRIIN